MATVEVDANQTQRRYRWLSRIVKFQLIVAILTIVICIVVGFQISPLIKQKAQLEREVKQKNEELKKLKEELDETNKRLNEAASLENMSADDVSLLKDLGPNLPKNEQQGTSLALILDQCHQAIAELQKIKSITPEKRRRSTITIRLYPRRIDEVSVQNTKKALEEYGFRTEMGEEKHEDTPTNAVWLVSPDVTDEDLK